MFILSYKNNAFSDRDNLWSPCTRPNGHVLLHMEIEHRVLSHVYIKKRFKSDRKIKVFAFLNATTSKYTIITMLFAPLLICDLSHTGLARVDKLWLPCTRPNGHVLLHTEIEHRVFFYILFKKYRNYNGFVVFVRCCKNV